MSNRPRILSISFTPNSVFFALSNNFSTTRLPPWYVKSSKALYCFWVNTRSLFMSRISLSRETYLLFSEFLSTMSAFCSVHALPFSMSIVSPYPCVAVPPLSLYTFALNPSLSFIVLTNSSSKFLMYTPSFLSLSNSSKTPLESSWPTFCPLSLILFIASLSMINDVREISVPLNASLNVSLNDSITCFSASSLLSFFLSFVYSSFICLMSLILSLRILFSLLLPPFPFESSSFMSNNSAVLL